MKITKNFWKVLSFELSRNLKKPAFWLSTLAIPFILVAYIAFSAFASYNASTAFDSDSSTTDMRIGLSDASGYLGTSVPDSFINADEEKQSLAHYQDLDAGKAALESQEIDLFYYLPTNFSTDLNAEVYVKPAQISAFADYTTPLKAILANTALGHVSPIDFAVITNAVNYETTTIDADNTVVDPTAAFARMGVPLIGLAIFYILIVVFGNRLTVAMVEEKENRISEMILATVRPDDLILGKVLSLMLLGFVQLLALIIPILIFIISGLSKTVMPLNLDIAVTPEAIISTLLLLILSYFLFTALCVTVGTIAPTAKDTSSFASVIVILVILPVFFLGDFIASTPSTAVYILSYFPPSAPIALMLRNAFDTLPTWEYWLGVADMAICAVIIFYLAVRFYRLYAIEFTARINLKKLLSRPRKTWKN